MVRFLYWEVSHREQSNLALERRMQRTELREEGDRVVLAAFLPEAGRVIGEVVLKWLSRAHRQGECGFVLNREYQGLGVATEAAREVLRLGFESLGLHRIVGRCDARNRVPARGMEGLGMRLEAHFPGNEVFKGDWGDELVYAMLESEWSDWTGQRSLPADPPTGRSPGR
ncbi:MAG: GNAT family N-acetyltransferase [Candidatus Dormibacteria bacterium]